MEFSVCLSFRMQQFLKYLKYNITLSNGSISFFFLLLNCNTMFFFLILLFLSQSRCSHGSGFWIIYYWPFVCIFWPCFLCQLYISRPLLRRLLGMENWISCFSLFDIDHPWMNTSYSDQTYPFCWIVLYSTFHSPPY